MEKNYESGNLAMVLKKMMLVMKLTTFLLLICAMHISASVYSQRTKLSIDVQGKSIKEVLQVIESQSDFRFIYENEKIDLDSKVNIRVEQQSVEDILKMLFDKRGIQYSITESNLILINPAGELPPLMQQTKNIIGKVTDLSGAPLPGVTVVIKGTSHGIITDADGNYSLADVPADATLVFSFVGMKMQEIPVAGQTTVNVEMQEETVGIGEVVAIGYGVQRKSDLTGAIASIKSETLTQKGTSRAVEAMRGNIAGLRLFLKAIIQSFGIPFRKLRTYRLDNRIKQH